MHVQASQWRSSFILTTLICIGGILSLGGLAAIAAPEIAPAWWRSAIWFNGVLIYGSLSVSQLLDIPLLTARRRREPGSQRRKGLFSAGIAALCGLNVVLGWLLL